MNKIGGGKLQVTHYYPEYRNERRYVALDYWVADRAHGPWKYFLCYGGRMNFEHPVRQEDIASRMESAHHKLFELPYPVPYDAARKLWVAPDGDIVYANKHHPRADMLAVNLGPISFDYRDSYVVEVRDLAQIISRMGYKSPAGTPQQRLLVDIQAIAVLLAFYQEHNLDPLATISDVEVAVRTLSATERLVIRIHLGKPGDLPHTWDEAGQAIGLSRERARQIFTRAIKKVAKRVRLNRARQRVGLPPETRTPPFTW